MAAQAATASTDRGNFRGLVHLADLIKSGTGVERVEVLLAMANDRQYLAGQCN
jgi:hypothetical protein